MWPRTRWQPTGRHDRVCPPPPSAASKKARRVYRAHLGNLDRDKDRAVPASRRRSRSPAGGGSADEDRGGGGNRSGRQSGGRPTCRIRSWQVAQRVRHRRAHGSSWLGPCGRIDGDVVIVLWCRLRAVASALGFASIHAVEGSPNSMRLGDCGSGSLRSAGGRTAREDTLECLDLVSWNVEGVRS